MGSGRRRSRTPPHPPPPKNQPTTHNNPQPTTHNTPHTHAPKKKKTVLGIILGGGAGTRLYPLTKKRAKPAVPLGANYRLIDIPVSNCVNSNVTKIYCLTQFNSASLNRHLSLAYNSSVTTVSRGFVEVLAASQSSASKNWFQGTADAVRQYMWLFEEAVRDGVQDFLVLSGGLVVCLRVWGGVGGGGPGPFAAAVFFFLFFWVPSPLSPNAAAN